MAWVADIPASRLYVMARFKACCGLNLPEVHGVKPLLPPRLHNGAGRNPAELLRPLRAKEAHKPALLGQAGHLCRCAPGLKVDGSGEQLAGQSGVLVLDDLIGALEGFLTEIPRPPLAGR